MNNKSVETVLKTHGILANSATVFRPENNRKSACYTEHREKMKVEHTWSHKHAKEKQNTERVKRSARERKQLHLLGVGGVAAALEAGVDLDTANTLQH